MSRRVADRDGPGWLAHRGREGDPWSLSVGAWRWLEGALLIAAPLLAFFGLRLRAMSRPVLPDPTMESVFLWDPSDWARRYAPSLLPAPLHHYIGPTAAYVRWGTRPGLLVPGRLAFLTFGTVPGFLVFRYALALIAIVPVYVLAKRCYGAAIGAVAVCLVLASPVIITAWGTDFPDAAAVSYLLGGSACLVMPPRSRGARRGWQLAAAVLLTAAVWALATTVLLVLVAVVVILVAAVLTDGWIAMLTDAAWLLIGAVGCTIALGIGSWLVLGRPDYVLPTIQAVLFLATPAQTVMWHSTNWRWAPRDAYLLVLPATCLAWAILALRRRRDMPGPGLMIGIIATLQLIGAAIGQFASTLQLLEVHYLSSAMWAASILALTVVIAELTRSLAHRRLARWLPAALVIAVTMISEITPAVPRFGWWPWGAALTALIIIVTAISVWLPRRLTAPGTMATVVILAALLALTVAPRPKAPALAGVVFDPPTGYQGALGGSASTFIDDYRLEEAVRHVVPNAAYQHEQLLDCLSDNKSALGHQLIGLFHNGINYIRGRCLSIGSEARAKIRSRHTAQLVALAPNQALDVPDLMRHLAPLHPALDRVARLHAGTESVQVAVIDFPARTRTSTPPLSPPAPRAPPEVQQLDARRGRTTAALSSRRKSPELTLCFPTPRATERVSPLLDIPGRTVGRRSTPQARDALYPHVVPLDQAAACRRPDLGRHGACVC